MKQFIILLMLFCVTLSYSFDNSIDLIDGFFISSKIGFLVKLDVARGLKIKRTINPEKKIENSIKTGMGEYGTTAPHGFPRITETPAYPYAEIEFNWGYKFPRVFTLGFGILLSNILMPYLTFYNKLNFIDKGIIRPYFYGYLHGGLWDGFPIGIMIGGGIDIFIKKNFYFLIESKTGAEIFIVNYYDDGINSNPIWHFESIYAYAALGIYIGVGYIIKNKYTDEKGKLLPKIRSKTSDKAM